jgi:diguanylate cyclase (GGDEF)-like protein
MSSSFAPRHADGTVVTAPTHLPRSVVDQAAMTVDSLRPVCAGVAVIFGGLVPVHLVMLKGDRAVIMAGVAGAISAIMLVLWYAFATDLSELLEQNAQAVGGAIGALCGVETLTHMATVGEPWVTTAVILVVMAVGACLSSRLASAIVIIATDLGWLGVVLVLGPNSVWWQAGAQLLAATVLSAVFNVIRYRTVERLETAKQAVADMALTDDLTGLKNRRGLLLTGEPLLVAARCAGRAISVVYLDVDGLKEVNDTRGHAAGDRLIASAGAALGAVFGTADVVARLGGDEFAVLLSGVDETVISHREELLRRELAANGISASVGIVHLTPEQDDQSLEQLVDLADAAMYEVKRGRGGMPLRLA